MILCTHTPRPSLADWSGNTKLGARGWAVRYVDSPSWSASNRMPGRAPSLEQTTRAWRATNISRCPPDVIERRAWHSLMTRYQSKARAKEGHARKSRRSYRLASRGFREGRLLAASDPSAGGRGSGQSDCAITIPSHQYGPTSRRDHTTPIPRSSSHSHTAWRMSSTTRTSADFLAAPANE